MRNSPARLGDGHRSSSAHRSSTGLYPKITSVETRRPMPPHGRHWPDWTEVEGFKYPGAFVSNPEEMRIPPLRSATRRYLM
ncbi:MAG: hypothetical protein J07HB67_01909 [halophilic archaeon J07HB67]|nr:MAG: hypothetical protein J07HB67_01909 [halophilic archaeon J07HB67]